MNNQRTQIIKFIFKKLTYSLFAFIATTGYASTPTNHTGRNNIETGNWSLGASVSTIGPGIELSKALSTKASISLGINYFNYNHPLNKLDEELAGDAKILLGGASAKLNYYLFQNLYLAGGVSYNQTALDVDGQMSESVFIGDIEMYPDEVGYVSLDITPEYKVAPYLGLGFGSILPDNKKVAFSFELGVMYHGKPQVELETTGMLEPTDTVEQEQLIQDNIAPLTFWPVMAFRLSFRLGRNQ